MERPILKNIAIMALAAACAASVAYNSATAAWPADYVGRVEMDGYLDSWRNEAVWPTTGELGGVFCPLPNRPPDCRGGATPSCPKPGVDPRPNAVAVAVAAVRIATVIYAAYKAQAGEPFGYEISYPAVVTQLEGTLDNAGRRTEWVQWVNGRSSRVKELRRVYQSIPAWNIFQRAEYKRLIDPGNQLALDTPWNQG